MDDIVGDADDAVLSILGDDRMDGRRVIQDARPCVAGERLREGALVEQAVAVEQVAPALLVLRRGPANSDLGRKSFRHKCLGTSALSDRLGIAASSPGISDTVTSSTPG